MSGSVFAGAFICFAAFLVVPGVTGRIYLDFFLVIKLENNYVLIKYLIFMNI